MDPANIVMHKSSIVEHKRDRSPRSTEKKAQRNHLEKRLGLIFEQIVAMARSAAAMAQGMHIHEYNDSIDDERAENHEIHMSTVSTMAVDLRDSTLRGWLFQVDRARTMAAHQIRNAVGTEDAISRADLQNCITMSDLLAALYMKGARLSTHEVELLWAGMQHDLGLKKKRPILTFSDFYRWMVHYHPELRDDSSRTMLVHVLEQDAFVDHFKWWEPMLDRVSALLDSAAERRFFKQKGLQPGDESSLAVSCGCGPRAVESTHHPRSDFLKTWEKQHDTSYTCA